MKEGTVIIAEPFAICVSKEIVDVITKHKNI